MNRSVALLVGVGLVPVGYAVQWLGWKLISWWTRPRAVEKRS